MSYSVEIEHFENCNQNRCKLLLLYCDMGIIYCFTIDIYYFFGKKIQTIEMCIESKNIFI